VKLEVERNRKRGGKNEKGGGERGGMGITRHCSFVGLQIKKEREGISGGKGKKRRGAASGFC